MLRLPFAVLPHSSLHKLYKFGKKTSLVCSSLQLAQRIIFQIEFWDLTRDFHVTKYCLIFCLLEQSFKSKLISICNCSLFYPTWAKEKNAVLRWRMKPPSMILPIMCFTVWMVFVSCLFVYLLSFFGIHIHKQNI